MTQLIYNQYYLGYRAMVEATIKDGLPSLSFVVARTKIQLISAFYLGKIIIGLDFSAPLHFGLNDIKFFLDYLRRYLR